MSVIQPAQGQKPHCLGDRPGQKPALSSAPRSEATAQQDREAPILENVFESKRKTLKPPFLQHTPEYKTKQNPAAPFHPQNDTATVDSYD